MKATLTKSYATLTREPGDSRISKESTVGYKLKLVLNAQSHHFVQYRGIKHELTACKLGLIDHKAKIILWHERYQIELAHIEFNAGHVTFQRVNF